MASNASGEGDERSAVWRQALPPLDGGIYPSLRGPGSTARIVPNRGAR